MALCASTADSGAGMTTHSKLRRAAAWSKILRALPARARGTGTQFMWQWFPPLLYRRNLNLKAKLKQN
jgi:hypothetical protein